MTKTLPSNLAADFENIPDGRPLLAFQPGFAPLWLLQGSWQVLAPTFPALIRIDI